MAYKIPGREGTEGSKGTEGVKSCFLQPLLFRNVTHPGVMQSEIIPNFLQL